MPAQSPHAISKFRTDSPNASQLPLGTLLALAMTGFVAILTETLL